MSDLALFADYPGRKLISQDGGAVTLPPLVLGDRPVCTLRIYDRTEGGDLRELDVSVRTLHASLGKVLEPPVSGDFVLKRDYIRPAVPATVTQADVLRINRVIVMHDGFIAYDQSPPPPDEGNPNPELASDVAFFNGIAYFTITAEGSTVTATAPVWNNGLTHLSVEFATLSELVTQGDDSEPAAPQTDFSQAIPIAATSEEFTQRAAEVFGSAIAEISRPAPACWVFRCATNASLAAVQVHENRLDPVSFVRIRSFQKGATWWHEVRLIQAPLAWNEEGHDRVLPAPPDVRRIREGRGGTETEPAVNEIQALRVPADFRGTYFLRWNFRVTRPIGIDDGPDEIAEALNAMFPDGAERFKATNPEPDNAYVEFTGKLGGEPQPLIEVQVNSFPPGVLTFALPLDRAELAAALRTVPEIELPLEVELEVVEPSDDPDAALPGRPITLFQQKVKVVREQKWKELGTLQHIDWLRPSAPRDYIPFTRDQVIIGVQHYVAAFGDGELRSFSFPHNLGTEAFQFCVRQNASNGRVLVHGEDFTLTIPSANEVILDVPAGKPAPALNALAITISTAGPRSAFLAHLHHMAQIIGLLDTLDLINARLEAIEDLLPSVSLALREREKEPREIEIPDRYELFPGRFPAGFDAKQIADGKDSAALPRQPGLLPAIHDATVENISVPLPTAASKAGMVFRNSTAAPLLVPGGLGRRGGYLEPNGFAGSDGRTWYRLSRAGSGPEGQMTNSFYPSDFERELLLLHINDSMWEPGETFSLAFDLQLQLVQANTRAQFLLVVETGKAPGQTTPAPVDENLADVTWNPKPLLERRIIVTGLAQKHHFGALIRRGLNNVMSADRILYTATLASDAPPPEPDFLIRARLVQFDTENSVRGAKGFVFYGLTEARAQLS